MNAVVKAEEPTQLPGPVARRGIDEAAWRTAMNSLFPGAKPESVLMVFDYCKARRLDPLKKPCHIVPIYVNGATRDVVMPGIYEYRTTAQRTGEYMGHSRPEYGPEITHLGVKAPESCSLVVYRWNKAAQQRSEYPVTVWFTECAATYWDKKDGADKINSRWTKAPRQMLTKCTEAAGLREAFPDELGGEHTAEEMEGQFSQTETTVITKVGDPRGDLASVDWELRDQHVSAITDMHSEYGSDENLFGEKLRAHIMADLASDPELYIAVHDKLAKDGIISKAAWKKFTTVPRVHE
jgi:phage recombination protein Bet